jgi:tetrapyrrole methylase family protein/MazG family protein
MARIVQLTAGDSVAALAGERLVVPQGHTQTITFLSASGLDADYCQNSIPEDAVLVLMAASPLDETVSIINRLLGPGGCPWDQKQTHESLKPYLIEEAYEVLDAIDRKDSEGLHEELGDVLLQPILHGQISAKNGSFDTYAIAARLNEKLIRRHPHVFGDVTVSGEAEVLSNWDQIKSQESGAEKKASILDGIPRSMPSLSRALALSKRAARQGFEWESLEGVYEKVQEEILEVRGATDSADRAKEVGDLLFSVVNLARWMDIDPEDALTQMLNRFTARYETMVGLADRPLTELSPEEWETLWRSAKVAEALADSKETI